MKIHTFRLTAADRQRLRVLVRERAPAWEEGGVGDAGGGENDKHEAELRRRLLALAAAAKGAEDPRTPVTEVADSPDEGMAANWEAIQRRIKAAPAAKVVALRGRSRGRLRALAPAVFSFMAVAAAALFFVVRASQPPTGDGMTMKGVGGTPATTVTCDVEPRTSAGSLALGAGSAAYQLLDQTEVVFGMRCSQAAYVQIQVATADGQSLQTSRNLKIAAGVRGILADAAGRPFAIVPPAAAALRLTVVVTAAPVPTDAALPADAETKSVAGVPVLWSDQLILRPGP